MRQSARKLTVAMVELLHRGLRVASHARSGRAGGFTTVAAHMPAAHRAHMEWTPQRLIDWGATIGPATAEAVTRLMAENCQSASKTFHLSASNTFHF